MPKQLTNKSIAYGWVAGENNWGDDVNTNFRRLSAWSVDAFAHDPGNTVGLTYAVRPGVVQAGNTLALVPAATLALPANTTAIYIERTPAGTTSFNTAGFTANRIPLAVAKTDASSILEVVDYRRFIQRTASDSEQFAGLILGADPGGSEQLKVTGSAKFTGDVAANTVSTSALTASTVVEVGNSLAANTSPAVDFHFGTGVAQDYNVRIINNANGALTFDSPVGVTAARFQFNGTVGARIFTSTNGIAALDSRNSAWQPGVFTFPQARWDFETAAALGFAGANFVALHTFAPWNDDTGEGVHQTAHVASNYAGSAGSVFYRYGTRTGGWNEWKRIVFTAGNGSTFVGSKVVFSDGVQIFNAGSGAAGGVQFYTATNGAQAIKAGGATISELYSDQAPVGGLFVQKGSFFTDSQPQGRWRLLGGNAQEGHWFGNDATAWFAGRSEANWRLFANGADRFTVDPNGNATIPGTFSAGGDVIAASDARLKSNVRTIERALSKVLELRGVEFEWQDRPGQHLGMIAQEVQAVVPAAVHAIKLQQGEFLGIATSGVVGLLVEAVRELAQEVASLREEIRS